MIRSKRDWRVGGRMKKTIGLNIEGKSEPKVYRVCGDVCAIVEKMLNTNRAIGPFSRQSPFEFAEVEFILDLLGAPVNEVETDDYAEVDLWISGG